MKRTKFIYALITNLLCMVWIGSLSWAQMQIKDSADYSNDMQEKSLSTFDSEIEELEKLIEKEEAAPKEEIKYIDILEVQDMPINDVLELISVKTGMTIDAPRNLPGVVTIYLKDVEIHDALRIILDTHNLAYVEQGAILRIITADAFYRQFGYQFGQKIQTRVVPLLHTKPTDTMKFLEQLKSPEGRVVYNEESNSFILTDSPQKIKAMEDFIKARDVQTETKTFALNVITAQDILTSIDGALSEGIGQIEINEQENSLTITDTSLRLDEIESLIKKLDQKEFEIVLETKTIQITLNDEHLNGVDWEAIVSDYKGIKFEGLEDFIKEGTRTLGLGTISQEDFVVLLDALDTVGIINPLSEDTMIAREDDETNIMVKYMVDPKDEKKAEEIKLYFRPKIVIEDEIELRIRPEFRFFDRYDFDRKFTSAEQMSVKSGSTLIVGSLFKDIKVEALWKVPLLGDIPFLGFAFRNQYSKTRKSEIIMFVTPKLVEKNLE